MALQGMGVVSRVSNVGLSALTKVTAALARQVLEQVCPAWGLPAPVVHAYPTAADVPDEHAVLLLMPDTADGYFGFHKLHNGRPVAYVRYGDTWPLHASHELIEMLVDPEGTMFVPGPSPVPSQGVVEFLVEACDPVQDFGYPLNGQVVADFCLPAYYSVATQPGTALSFKGNVASPFAVERKGYITWRHQGDFWQLDRFGPNPRILNQGPQNPVTGSYRAAIDAARPDPTSLSQCGRSRSFRPVLAEAKKESARQAAGAAQFREEVQRFRRARRRRR